MVIELSEKGVRDTVRSNGSSGHGQILQIASELRVDINHEAPLARWRVLNSDKFIFVGQLLPDRARAIFFESLECIMHDLFVPFGFSNLLLHPFFVLC